MMIKKLISSIFKILVLASFGLAQANAQATTAGILPLAKTQFFDQNGNPLTSGKVYFYSPGTTTAKTTWKDINEATPNTNPVNLDANGYALIWGNGSYRQQVYDRNNNLIWDQTTASAGSGSSGSTIGDGLPVGTILQSSGLIAPTNYQFAYGQTLSRSLFPQLLAALTITSNITCTGGSPTITNIADTSSISVGTALEAACVTGNPTVISKTSTTVTLNSNANISFTSAGTFYPYGNGDGLTTFNVPDYRGYVVAGRCNMGGVDCLNVNSTYFSSNANNTPSSLNAKGGSQSSVLLASNLPPHTHTSPTLTDPGHTHTQTIFQQLLAGLSGAGNGWSSGTTANTGNSTTGITLSANTGTNASGTSTPLSIMQPTVTANYIIKVTPDSNLTSTFGVASIGGMTGIISCGTNVVCAGNTISVPTVGGFGNPSSLVGLTAINGALGTAMRSDAAPALSQAIAPVWTGVHAFLGGIMFAIGGNSTNLSPIITGLSSTANLAVGDVIVGGGIPLGSTISSIDSSSQIHISNNATSTGANGYTFGNAPTQAQTFVGSGLGALIQQNLSAVAGSNTAAEILRQEYMHSATGAANHTNAFKILTSGTIDCQADTSADCYLRNDILNITHNSVPASYFGTGNEMDINNNSGLNLGTSSNFASLSAIYGFVSVASGSNSITSNYWATGAGGSSFAGYAATGNFIAANGAGFYDNTNSPNVLLGQGTHSVGVNLFSATITAGVGTAFVSPNNVGFGSANAAGNATIPLLYLDASNRVQHGSTAVISHTFSSNPGGSSAAISMINSHATAGDILLQLQGGTATAVDATTLYLNMVNAANSVQRGQIIAADAAGVGHVAYQTASDERLKRSLGPLDNPIDRLMSIEVHRYQAPNYKGDDFDVGFFAQNLYRAYPWAVTPSKDPDFHKHPWQVDYGRVTPLLVAATQEMQHEISNLHSRLDAIEHRSSKRYHHHP